MVMARKCGCLIWHLLASLYALLLKTCAQVGECLALPFSSPPLLAPPAPPEDERQFSATQCSLFFSLYVELTRQLCHQPQLKWRSVSLTENCTWTHTGTCLGKLLGRGSNAGL